MRDESYDKVARRWSEALSVPVTDLVIPGVHVVAHGRRLADYNGIYAWHRRNVAIISTPPPYLERLSSLVGALDAPRAFDARRLARIDDAVRVIGPAFQGYVDASSFAPASNAHTARRLDDDDRDAVDVLRFQCDPVEWEHGSIDTTDATALFGCFDGVRLVAAARVAARSGLADIGVVTHPMHRGRGHGRAVVSAAVAASLGDDAVVQYQTLLENAASVAVATVLGFEQWCETIAVRLEARD